MVVAVPKSEVSKLEELESLQRQVVAIEKRQEELKAYQGELENHKQALAYEKYLADQAIVYEEEWDVYH